MLTRIMAFQRGANTDLLTKEKGKNKKANQVALILD